MNNKKQVFLSLETARKMWKTGHEPTQSFCLDNFTKEELEAKELPKTWEELKFITGAWVNTEDDSLISESTKEYPTDDYNKNIFPTKELAEASLALSFGNFATVTEK